MQQTNPFSAKNIACIAAFVAIVIGSQYALSFVSGIEIVTLLFVCFAYVFGAKNGMLAAVAFALLRCCLFGFYPAVVVLYLLYYPLLSLTFGLLGHVKTETYRRFPLSIFLAVSVILLGVLGICLWLLLGNIIQLPHFYQGVVTISLYVVIVLCGLLWVAWLVLFILKKTNRLRSEWQAQLILLTAVAALCTICFTLIDDVISPLFVGMDLTAALSYFYTSLVAMLPQTICTIVTVSTLFYPITSVLFKIKRQ